MWSLPYSSVSPWAQELKEWLLLQDLVIVNLPLTPTWCNATETQSSAIDLMVVNSAEIAQWELQVSCDVSFADAGNLNHAALLLILPLPLSIPPLPTPPFSGWHVDPLLHDKWIKLFCTYSFPSSCSSCNELLALWQSVCTAIEQVSNSLFVQRSSHPCLPSTLS